MEERREGHKDATEFLEYSTLDLINILTNSIKKDLKLTENRMNETINKNQEKINLLDKNVKKLEKELIDIKNNEKDKIEELTNNIAKLQSNVDKFINDNQEQINVLSDSIKKINNNINDESSIKINSLNDSVIKLENKINELTSNNAMGLKILEERLNKSINKNQKEVIELTNSFKNIENKINDIETLNTKSLEAVINNLQSKFDDFEKKFEFLLNEVKKVQYFIHQENNKNFINENKNVINNKTEDRKDTHEIIEKYEENNVDVKEKNDNQDSIALEENIEVEQNSIKDNKEYHERIKSHTLELINMLDKEEAKPIRNVDYDEVIKKASDCWLTPCYLTLIGLINKDNKLVQKAMDYAISKEDKNIALFFTLINTKMKKQKESLLWFKKYLRLQEVNLVGNEFPILLEAYLNGVFGEDLGGECKNIIKTWFNQLSEEESFCKQQKEYWKNFIKMKIYEYDTNAFPYINKYCTNLDEVKKPLNGLTMHKNIRNYFEMLDNAKPEEIKDLSPKIDKILYNLVEKSNEENKDNLVDERDNGFKQFLFGKQLKTPIGQKLFYELSKKWIIEAYSELNSENIASIPTKIKIKLDKWESYTLDGSNKDALLKSLHKFYEREKNAKLDQTKLKGKTYGTLVGAIFFAILGIFITPFLFLLTIGLGYSFYRDYKKIIEEKDGIIYSYNSLVRDYENIVDALCLEVINYRKILIDYTEYNHTVSYLKQI